MTLLMAKLIWLAGCVGWWAIRYPHERVSKKTAIASRTQKLRERILLAISFSGMFLIPLFYAVTDQPKFASYPLNPVFTGFGAILFAATLYLFHIVHRDLGRSWSVTLELRNEHALITHGLYRYLRHPMYSAFWLWAVAQALLLPNWIAGFSGLVGFGTLYFCRVGSEERMMEEAFGAQYRDYAARTKRIIPGIY
jgi:protein-S-isoprenylcysteine O-methyltransferase Ste14